MARKNEKLQSQVDQLIDDLEKIRNQEKFNSLREEGEKLKFENLEKSLEASTSREHQLRRLNIELTQRLKLYKVTL